MSCARCFSKTLKLYDFICVPIGTDRLALYRFATTSLCEQLRVHWRESSDFCYVLPRGEGVRAGPTLDRGASWGGARTCARTGTLYPDAAPAQACVTADTVIVGRASGRARTTCTTVASSVEIEYMLSCANIGMVCVISDRICCGMYRTAAGNGSGTVGYVRGYVCSKRRVRCRKTVVVLRPMYERLACCREGRSGMYDLATGTA